MDIPTSLRNAALHLRRLDLSDALALMAAARAAGHVDGLDACGTLHEARALIARYELEAQRGSQLVYGVFSPDGATLLGCAHVMPVSSAVQIGTWLTASARGQGLGRASIAALCELCDRWLGAPRLELWCALDNTPMRRIAAACGFREIASPGDHGCWLREERVSEPTLFALPDTRPRPTQIESVWTCIVEHLHATHEVTDEWATACDVALEVPLAEGATRQIVTVEHGSVGGAPWLMLRATVGPQDRIDGREALRHNGTLAIGALAIEDGLHVIRHGVCPAGIGVDGIDRLIEHVGHEAARLRQRGKPASSPHFAAFAAFAD